MLFRSYRAQAGNIQREYILEEERSFTIIAFPIPEIGKDFKGIFEDTIKINISFSIIFSTQLYKETNCDFHNVQYSSLTLTRAMENEE